MAAKTSQLQIRVTEEQKAVLKRLAGAAEMTVSQYVLAQAIPSRHQRLSRILESLGAASGDPAASFADLAALLDQTDSDDFTTVLGGSSLGSLNPLVQNQLAAMVEQTANRRFIDPPPWVEAAPALARPHFAWPLSSLRPHQIRVTPTAFKRRGIFFDPASRPEFSSALAGPAKPRASASEAWTRLAALDEACRVSELKVEFYFLGGAVLVQAFSARPRTAHIEAMLRPASAVLELQAALSKREGWPAGWAQEAVQEHLGKDTRASRYLELPNLAAFVPPLEYVLALSVARLRLGPDQGGADLRYVLRALNLTTAEEALEVTERYFTPRQLPEDARATLHTLLAT